MPKEIYSEGLSVTLRDISIENLREILKLEVADSQKSYVAPNAVSVAQAHYTDTAWFKGIYADGIPVGFVMLDDNPETSTYFLWRLMIDQRYQGMGYGKAALTLVSTYVKTRPGAKAMLTSFVPGTRGPEGFYQKLGFLPTGAMEEDEVVYTLSLNEEGIEGEVTESHPIGVSHEVQITDQLVSTEALYDLYEALGWNDYLKLNHEALGQAMAKSYKVLYATIDDRLVGTGRLISDGVINAYFCGLGVHPEFQGLGIGSELTRQIFEVAKENGLHLQLFCDTPMVPYYEKFGCKVFEVGMKHLP
jgi:diamine N-acetyltransferase